MLCSPIKTGEARLCNTWQKVSCHRSIVKDTNLRSWQCAAFYIRESFLRKGMMKTHYDVSVPKKQGK